MPRQDAQGRWISDDGLQYWDGSAWRPTGAAAAAKSPWPAILIGCAFALVVVIVLGIAGLVLLFNNANFQRTICNSMANSNRNQVCPFNTATP